MRLILRLGLRLLRWSLRLLRRGGRRRGLLLLLLLLELLLLRRRSDFRLRLGGLEARDGRGGVDLAGGGVDDGDAVVIESVGEGLLQSGAIGGIAGAGGDELGFGAGDAALLLEDVGGGGSAEVQL